MVSRVAALIKFLENLWKFLTGFHLTCEEPGNIVIYKSGFGKNDSRWP